MIQGLQQGRPSQERLFLRLFYSQSVPSESVQVECSERPGLDFHRFMLTPRFGVILVRSAI